jgi:hypothetical protein
MLSSEQVSATGIETSGIRRVSNWISRSFIGGRGLLVPLYPGGLTSHAAWALCCLHPTTKQIDIARGA